MLAVAARRMHDTGRSARWWIIIFLTGLLGMIASIALLYWAAIESEDSGYYDGFGLALLIILIFLAWLVVNGVVVRILLILCALPGTIGSNRYGPDPLRPEQAMGGYGDPITIRNHRSPRLSKSPREGSSAPSVGCSCNGTRSSALAAARPIESEREES